jgi:hypothetical protein
MHIDYQGGKPVCMLATIAALTDRPLTAVEEHACKVAGVRKWCGPKMRKQASYWPTVETIAKYYGGEALWNAVALYSSPHASQALPGYVRTIPDTGRGSIIIRRRPSECHIVAWENGRVFDSNFWSEDKRTQGVPLAEWLAHYEGFRILRITVLDGNGKPETVYSNPEDEPTAPEYE